MRRRLTLWFATLLAAPLLIAAQEQQASPVGGELQTAKIISVQAHAEGRAFDWVARGAIAIYDRYPFYDLVVDLAGMTYTVRYESQTGYYPAAWKAGNSVQVRVARGKLYLLRYDDVEVPAAIVHRGNPAK